MLCKGSHYVPEANGETPSMRAMGPDFGGARTTASSPTQMEPESRVSVSHMWHLKDTVASCLFPKPSQAMSWHSRHWQPSFSLPALSSPGKASNHWHTSGDRLVIQCKHHHAIREARLWETAQARVRREGHHLSSKDSA